MYYGVVYLGFRAFEAPGWGLNFEKGALSRRSAVLGEEPCIERPKQEC